MTFEIRVPLGSNSHALKQGETLSIDFPDGKGVQAKIADVDIEPGGSRFAIICTPEGTYPDRPLTDVWSKEDRDAQIARDEAKDAPEGDDAWVSVPLLQERLRAAEERSRANGAELLRILDELSRVRGQKDEWERNARNWERQYWTLTNMTGGDTHIHNTTVVDESGIHAPGYSIGRMTGETQEVDMEVSVKETFQVESPRSRVRVSYGTDGAVEIEITTETTA